MASIGGQLGPLVPALLFLLAGVPLARLLDEVGFFEALTDVISGPGRTVPVLGLWVLAAVTTATLNLDTTVVVLTPLYLRLAKRAEVDPLPVVLIPLLLAAFASSILPVSNLTTLIVQDQVGLSVAEVVSHLALPSVAACVVGWLAYRRRYPLTLAVGPATVTDHRALTVGGLVAGGAVVGFVVGPEVGVAPWVVAVAADLVLVAVTRRFPYRDLPVLTALAVATVAVVVGLALPADRWGGVERLEQAVGVVPTTTAAVGAANTINNLPAVLLSVTGTTAVSWGLWAWLLGVNVGAVLLPWGALANLLWWRVGRGSGLDLSLRLYVRSVVPIALPAAVAATALLTLERLVA